MLSLRTCKSDVVVGVPAEVEAVVAAQDPRWRVNGEWGTLLFAPRGKGQPST